MGKQNNNLISLKFIVNGVETVVENVNIHQPLRVAVQKALNQTGNQGRDINDWQVIYNDQHLDINKKVEEFSFPDGVVII